MFTNEVCLYTGHKDLSHVVFFAIFRPFIFSGMIDTVMIKSVLYLELILATVKSVSLMESHWLGILTSFQGRPPTWKLSANTKFRGISVDLLSHLVWAFFALLVFHLF